MLSAPVALHLVLALLAAGHVVLQDKRPPTQWGWILAVALIPVLGLACYLLLGTDRLWLRRLRRRLHFHPLAADAFRSRGVIPADAVPAPWDRVYRTLTTLSGTHPTGGNAVEVLADAAAFYPALAAAIDGAREQLWLCFFVWRDDAVGRDFVARLAAAARRGVAVRVLVDEVGSRHTPRRLFRPLERAGGRFSWATTLFPRRNRWFLNLRNHRKIVVADGTEALTGGMNIGCEYVDGVDGNHWNDCQLAIRGPAVTQLAAVFAEDWHFATGERLAVARRADRVVDGVPIQLIAGGPDHSPTTNARALEAVIHAARDTIVLTTPYFVPGEELLAALELATARGVRVRLLVSAETDVGPLLLLSRSYFERLLRAGVEVCEYGDDIHHGKLILVDGALAVVGSINLDVRSLHLNYEIAACIHDPGVVADLDAYLTGRSVGCRVLDRERFARRPLRHRLHESCLRLIAPLL